MWREKKKSLQYVNGVFRRVEYNIKNEVAKENGGWLKICVGGRKRHIEKKKDIRFKLNRRGVWFWNKFLGRSSPLTGDGWSASVFITLMEWQHSATEESENGKDECEAQSCGWGSR